MSNDAQQTGFCILASELAIPLEILANLTFLTMKGSERPDEVRMYMRMAEEQLSLLRVLASRKLGVAQSGGQQTAAV